jgi:hypothetical protein
MARWDNLTDEDRLLINEVDLPVRDAMALERAFGNRARPRSVLEGGRLPSKASIRCYKQSYRRFAGHLRRIGRLHPDQEPLDRATEENLGSFFNELVTAGLAGHTVCFYFQALRRAFQRMYPGQDFRYITHPDGIPLHQRLDMSRRDIKAPHLDDLIQLAKDCFHTGVETRSHARRFNLVRDAAILAILCDAPARRRALGEMRANINLQKRDGKWWLLLEPANTKMRRVERHCLSPWSWPILERYVTVELNDLLAGRPSGALWLRHDGRPLAERGVVKRIQWHSERRFGKAFGPHMSRYAVAGAQAGKPSVGPFSASIRLGHSNPNSTIPYLRAAAIDGVAERHAASLAKLRRMTERLADRSYRRRENRLE